MLCVIVCNLETPRMWRPWPALGCSSRGGKNKLINILFENIIIPGCYTAQTGKQLPTFSKNRCAYVFVVNPLFRECPTAKVKALLSLETVVFSCTSRHTVTSPKDCLFSSTAIITSNLSKYCLFIQSVPVIMSLSRQFYHIENLHPPEYP